MGDLLPTPGGAFELGSLLGEGATGAVYEALAPGGEVVAIKVLRAELMVDARAQALFRREAELLGKISHPGVIGIHGSGVLADGRPYLVMDRVAGKTLAQALPLPLPRVIALAS